MKNLEVCIFLGSIEISYKIASCPNTKDHLPSVSCLNLKSNFWLFVAHIMNYYILPENTKIGISSGLFQQRWCNFTEGEDRNLEAVISSLWRIVSLICHLSVLLCCELDKEWGPQYSSLHAQWYQQYLTCCNKSFLDECITEWCLFLNYNNTLLRSTNSWRHSGKMAHELINFCYERHANTYIF